MSHRVVAGILGLSLAAACSAADSSEIASTGATTTSVSEQAPAAATDAAATPGPSGVTTTAPEPGAGGDDAGIAPRDSDWRPVSCAPSGARSTRSVVTPQFPSTDRDPVDKRPILALRGLQLCSGQPQAFRGSQDATVSVNMLWGMDIRCTFAGDDGTPHQQSLRRSVMSTRNHGGTGQQSQAVRWLFTPDRDGIYDCEVRAWGKTPAGGSGTMTVVPGAGTELSVSGVEPGGREWRQEQSAYLCHDNPDDPGCSRSATVLDDVFEATDAARTIDVYAGVEASVCTSAYADCTSGTAGTRDFTIRTRLIATQLVGPDSRTLCDGAQPHVTDRTTAVPGGQRLNHVKVHLEDTAVPVVQNSSCSPYFAIRVLVDYVRTHPPAINHGGLVEGRVPDSGTSNPENLNRYYTNAIATNNV
ncbi:MAG: hypothetical protein ACRDZV_03320 [Acidimicrobiia bacterium]